MHSSFIATLPEDVDPREPDVVVEYDYHAPEKMTRHYPGSDEHCDVTDVTLNGRSVMHALPTDLLERLTDDAMEDATAGSREQGD